MGLEVDKTEITGYNVFIMNKIVREIDAETDWNILFQLKKTYFQLKGWNFNDTVWGLRDNGLGILDDLVKDDCLSVSQGGLTAYKETLEEGTTYGIRFEHTEGEYFEPK